MQFQALAFWVATLPAMGFVSGFEDFNGYEDSCQRARLIEGGSVLEMDCWSDNLNGLIQNKLDLNKCLGVDDERKLTFKPDGKFAADCEISTCVFSTRRIDGDSKLATFLACECGPENGFTDIELNEGLANKNGKLVCDGGEAQVWEWRFF